MIPIDLIEQAACASSGEPDAWFPSKESAQGDTAYALAICKACPIQAACLTEALEMNEMGLWGGTTGADRARLTGTRHPRTNHASGPQQMTGAA